MQEVWGAIKSGANAYLTKQFWSILPLIGVLTIALFLSVYVVPPHLRLLHGIAAPFRKLAQEWIARPQRKQWKPALIR